MLTNRYTSRFRLQLPSRLSRWPDKQKRVIRLPRRYFTFEIINANNFLPALGFISLGTVCQIFLTELFLTVYDNYNFPQK